MNFHSSNRSFQQGVHVSVSIPTSCTCVSEYSNNQVIGFMYYMYMYSRHLKNEKKKIGNLIFADADSRPLQIQRQEDQEGWARPL